MIQQMTKDRADVNTNGINMENLTNIFSEDSEIVLQGVTWTGTVKIPNGRPYFVGYNIDASKHVFVLSQKCIGNEASFSFYNDENVPAPIRVFCLTY